MNTYCCDKSYICPVSKELECYTHGGFNICCDNSSCPGHEINMEPDSVWRYNNWGYDG